MGLTSGSTGIGAIDRGGAVLRRPGTDAVVALAGNPNVGKSTVFNALTGMEQHTGNWPGKTVASAQGVFKSGGRSYVLVDIPGTYSLTADSAEEEVARDFICFGSPDAVVVVCDATCLERNLNLVLQTLEITPRAAVCVNLMDEAKKKHIIIDTERLSAELGVPVCALSARKKQGFDGLADIMDAITSPDFTGKALVMQYPERIEAALEILVPVLDKKLCGRVNARWLGVRILCGELRGGHLRSELDAFLRDGGRGGGLLDDPDVTEAIAKAEAAVRASASDGSAADAGDEGGSVSGADKYDSVNDAVAAALLERASELCAAAVRYEKAGYAAFDRRVDRVLTGKWSAFPLMLLLFAFIFWLTIVGANYPSELLSRLFEKGYGLLSRLFDALGAPGFVRGVILDGMYRVLSWVVAVMLPPMAIFFPLFTLLEDAGYLPRIAYDLDRPFKCCHACGKQALTMCMGFGCNAAGVVGCRIISSPRERLIAILTNSFVPCNGRFPMLITVITLFFAFSASGTAGGLVPAAILAAVIVLSVLMTLLMSYLLSKTLLRGQASSFTLELPPYRMPNIGQVLIRSLLDRTLYVLGRAAVTAVPCGAVIYLLANVNAGGSTLLALASGALEPVGRLMGLDGAVLLAFILGFPANELVIPIMLMIYTSGGTLAEMGSLAEMRTVLTAHGWTWLTAAAFILFALMHWPCGTTLMTIKKETGSAKWTLLGFLIPTLTGFLLCVLLNSAAHIFA